MRTMKLIRPLLLVALASLLTVTSCQDLGVDPLGGGPGIIVPGIGVEGLKLGDERAAVEAVLEPATSVGWADGIYRSWRILAYEVGPRSPYEDPRDRLVFYFLDMGKGVFGPLDEIEGGPEYQGKTKEGIGIGSALSRAREVYGPPVSTILMQDKRSVADFYCINGRKFEVHYTDSLLRGFSIGYLIPMPQDPNYPCK